MLGNYSTSRNVVIADVRHDIINTARSQLHVREVNNNSGPDIDQYLASVGLDSGYNWCGAFAGWVYQKNKILIPGNAAFSPNWFTENRTRNPRLGDIGGIYNKSLKRIGHVLIYEENWADTNNMITTIEGNVNGPGGRGVHRLYRSKRQIHKSANWINT